MELLRVSLLVIFNNMVHSSYRKIKDGARVDESIRYMVYLTKAKESETEYDAWICGGAIVSTTFIVTSAACVEDVKRMYAISGFSKYVNVDDIEKNDCTKASRKKIVFICLPKRYNFAYDPVEKWAFIDIAAVKVESPYNFSAPVLPGCSWTPNKIEINYDAKYQEPNTDAIIMGWGHTEKWRKPGDKIDYNEEDLRYSPILIMHKPECKRLYRKTPKLLPIIDKYMICAMHTGNLNIKGNPISEAKEPYANGCPPGYRRDDNSCAEPHQSYTEENGETLRSGSDDSYQLQDEINSDVNSYQHHTTKSPPKDDTRTEISFGYQNQQNKPTNNAGTKNPYGYQQNNTTNDSPVDANPSEYNDDVISFEDIIMNVRRTNEGNATNRLRYTRKAGICQNDHGGPLVTWVGKHERLIGVASVFRLDKSSRCVGPYLFTSTQCNGAFLDCIVNGNDGNSRRLTLQKQAFCDLPPAQKGFDVVKRTVSWKDHPDGPAENELKDALKSDQRIRSPR